MRAPRLSEQARLVVLAAVVGLLTGWGAVGFVLLLERITEFARGPVAAVLGRLGLPALVLLPALGGLLVGPLTHRVAREARGHGVPLVIMALARRGGRIVKRVAAVDVGAALLTIGFGGAAGRAGPIVQIGSVAGSGGRAARAARLRAGADPGGLRRRGGRGRDLQRAARGGGVRLGGRRRTTPVPTCWWS